ncbi:MAG: hypothetical protein M1815_005621 [Lichina confinis]|nr:MAG: hypothetical protein M1815_005621 [Lichina confinis]
MVAAAGPTSLVARTIVGRWQCRRVEGDEAGTDWIDDVGGGGETLDRLFRRNGSPEHALFRVAEKRKRNERLL